MLRLCLFVSLHGFVFALLSRETSKQQQRQKYLPSRRDVFQILSGVMGIASMPQNAIGSSDLISLESAALQLSRDDSQQQQLLLPILSHRLNYPHPGLRKKASPVTSFGTRNLEILVEALVQTMETSSTTPTQYGIDARIIVLKGVEAPNPSSTYSVVVDDNDNKGVPITVFVNPTILARSTEDKMVPWKEYCLVVGTEIVWPEGEAPKPETPGSSMVWNAQQSLLEVDLLRDETVEIAAQDIAGKPIRMSLSGEASRAFQHELDHLNGILIVDHAGLEDLPPAIAFLEEPLHKIRQARAFDRSVYQGNGPLYY